MLMGTSKSASFESEHQATCRTFCRLSWSVYLKIVADNLPFSWSVLKTENCSLFFFCTCYYIHLFYNFTWKLDLSSQLWPYRRQSTLNIQSNFWGRMFGIIYFIWCIYIALTLFFLLLNLLCFIKLFCYGLSGSLLWMFFCYCKLSGASKDLSM